MNRRNNNKKKVFVLKRDVEPKETESVAESNAEPKTNNQMGAGYGEMEFKDMQKVKRINKKGSNYNEFIEIDL
jgi:hypothetical protein